MYPMGSVPNKTERIDAACGLFFESVGGEKKRSITMSTIAAIPPVRTLLIRVSPLDGGPDWGGGGKPLPDGPTQGQAAESKLRNAQNTRQAKNIFAQHLNGIFAFRRIRCSMASYVISQNLEVRKQIRYLKLPHSVVGTNRVRQDQDRPPCISLQAVEHSRVPNCCERQIFAPCRYFFRSEFLTKASRNGSEDPRYC